MAVINTSNNQLSQSPNIDVTASATATGATATATMPAVAGKTNVLTGFDVSATGTITAGTATVTGIGSGTLTYGIPAGMTTPLVVQFTSPMVCTAGPNNTIAVACSTLGAASAFVNAYGFLV